MVISSDSVTIKCVFVKSEHSIYHLGRKLENPDETHKGMENVSSQVKFEEERSQSVSPALSLSSHTYYVCSILKQGFFVLWVFAYLSVEVTVRMALWASCDDSDLSPCCKCFSSWSQRCLLAFSHDDLSPCSQASSASEHRRGVTCSSNWKYHMTSYSRHVLYRHKHQYNFSISVTWAWMLKQCSMGD